MGPSGCGKSTLLNIIGGLLPADGGEIKLQKRSYGLKGPSSVVDVRRDLVGWIFQDFHLLNNLSALDNVAMALELSGTSSTEAEQRAAEALIKVGLEDRMHHIPDQLSGGQQQRVAVARAVVHRPSIILCDEPTGNLDTATSHQVMGLLQAMNQEENTTFLIVTHDGGVAARCQRTITMNDGVIVRDQKDAEEE